jgi:predicted DNA-binding mobile mystery protein A
MPSTPLSEIELRQLSDRLQALREVLPLRTPPAGWLSTIRRAMGVRTAQLASRLGVTQPTVVRMEEREVAGGITLETLRRAADQLDCDLVYYLIPRRSLLQTVLTQAEELAREEAAAVAHSMEMEWQVVPPPAVVEQIEQNIAKLVAQRPARLWSRKLRS